MTARKVLLAALAAGTLVACAQEPPTSAANGMPGPGAVPVVQTYKSPSCGCCDLWVEHMRAAGFEVQVTNTAELDRIRRRAGVPPGHGSCHTAEVSGYFIEGHVPADDVRRLLAERPEARGLMVPGMVLGSPGMEQGTLRQPFEVLLVGSDGSTSVYSRHNQPGP